MVIVQINGGLGNQMFQYATGRSLAKRKATVLKLDLSIFETYRLHQYALHSFHIWEHIATEDEIARIKGTPYRGRERFVIRLGNRLGFSHLLLNRLSAGRVLRESSPAFNPEVLGENGNLYLEGYWQSENYFLDIREILLQEFTVKYPQDEKNRKIMERIRNTDAISLHVRRGDYVLDPKTYNKHGVCTPDYYERCVQYMVNKVKHPHFFIFSDEPDWVKANLHLDHPTTYIDHNGASRNYEDLRLMSQCSHHIIANSSFSWWGAWLCTGAQKIVLAPKRWFQDLQYADVSPVPDSWIAI